MLPLVAAAAALWLGNLTASQESWAIAVSQRTSSAVLLLLPALVCCMLVGKAFQ